MNSFVCLDAALSEQPMVDILAGGVKIIQHNISVAAMWGRKHNDFKVLAQFFKAFDCIRSNIYASLLERIKVG